MGWKKFRVQLRMSHRSEDACRREVKGVLARNMALHAYYRSVPSEDLDICLAYTTFEFFPLFHNPPGTLI
jgi:hypothetical protein